MKNRISFIGLSHLSVSYLLASISKGYMVTAYDRNPKTIKNFLVGNPDIDEENLVKKIHKYKKKIHFTHQINEIRNSKMIFIGIDIITNNLNKPNYHLLNFYLEKIKSLKLNNKIPIIILSQLSPGFMAKVKMKNDLYYHVETLIFGEGYKRAAFPERIIIGKKNEDEAINSEYIRYLKKFKCPIYEMNYQSAELCKIAINILLASSLTASNILASLAEKIGANYLNLVPALKKDKRIGKFAYINPGLGISGGNIERDLHVAFNLLKVNKINKSFIKSIINFSNVRKDWVFKKLIELKKYKKVTILGLSYKKNNKSIKNSPTVRLISKLNQKKIKFCIYDDLIKKSNYVNFTNDIDRAVSFSNCIILMREFDNKKKINNLCKKLIKNKKIIIDPFNVLNNLEKKNKLIFQLGN